MTTLESILLILSILSIFLVPLGCWWTWWLLTHHPRPPAEVEELRDMATNTLFRAIAQSEKMGELGQQLCRDSGVLAAQTAAAMAQVAEGMAARVQGQGFRDSGIEGLREEGGKSQRGPSVPQSLNPSIPSSLEPIEQVRQARADAEERQRRIDNGDELMDPQEAVNG